MNGGRAVFAFFADVDAQIAECAGEAALAEFCVTLKETRDRLEQATLWFLEKGMENPDHLAAGSTDYLHLFALTALGLMWLRMARAAHAGLAAGAGDAGFYNAKLATARYFMQRVMPDSISMLAKIKSGADAMMALPADAF